MIEIERAKPEFHVWRGAWKNPSYGIIVEVKNGKVVVNFLLENLENLTEECDPSTLHWPPDFCRFDRANPKGQPFSDEYTEVRSFT